MACGLSPRARAVPSRLSTPLSWQSSMSDPALTIRTLRTRAVAAPLARPLRTASGTIPESPLLLIDVASDQGPVGRAYIFAYTTLTLRALKSFLDDLAEVVTGQPAHPASMYDHLVGRFRLMGRQGLVGMALSGLDMALWDMQGRAQKPTGGRATRWPGDAGTRLRQFWRGRSGRGWRRATTQRGSRIPCRQNQDRRG